MARIRTIKPEFWVDDQIVELDFVTRLLFIGIWNFVDDEGYIEFKAKRIKMQVFPADDLDVSRALQNLLEANRLLVCDSDQGELLSVVNWQRHQKISNPTPTKFTAIVPRTLGSEADSLEKSVPVEKNSYRSALKGKEGKGKERKGDVPEVRPDVSALCNSLADLIEGNGSKRPNVTKGWLDAARLMLDRDKRPVAEATALIGWVQADPFWKANILSMVKFREKYDTVRLQRESKAETTKPKPKVDWMNR